MTINIGEVLPNYTLSRFGTKGLENVQLHDFIGNNINNILNITQ